MPDKLKKGDSKLETSAPDFDGFREGLFDAVLEEEGDPQGFVTESKKVYKHLVDSVKGQPKHIKLHILFLGFLAYVVLQTLKRPDPYPLYVSLSLLGGFGFQTLKVVTDHAKED